MTDTPSRFPGDPVRETLASLIVAAGEDYKSLSRLIGRNAAYIHQFLYRGTPRRLGERERAMLADYFGVAEAALGAAPPRAGASMMPGLTLVPRIDVGASAGGGGLAEDDPAAPPFAFDARWLKQLSAEPKRLAIIRVEGDSMAPTLAHGDDIMVDSSDAAVRLRDGIYVLRRDGVLLVKRLARAAARDRVTIISDNSAYPSEAEVPVRTLEIVGRVKWTGRQIG
jgi:phage repressor protein C with HTH and peptisase S24 domain